MSCSKIFTLNILEVNKGCESEFCMSRLSSSFKFSFQMHTSWESRPKYWARVEYPFEVTRRFTLHLREPQSHSVLGLWGERHVTEIEQVFEIEPVWPSFQPFFCLSHFSFLTLFRCPYFLYADSPSKLLSLCYTRQASTNWRASSESDFIQNYFLWERILSFPEKSTLF